MNSKDDIGKDNPTKSNKYKVNSVLINRGDSKTIIPLKIFSAKFDL
tara:strand:+ start:256 stop:393 length:138 start_codon:yes stop_codon:yes gene_type:complete